MLEIELKFPVHDPQALMQGLAKLGYLPGQTKVEVDHYYNAPDRDFAQTDEALRLRQSGEQCWLTYKGPKQGKRGKTRVEIEIPQVSGTEAQLHQLLQKLGYRPTATVRKQRTYFHKPHGADPLITPMITLDEVDRVGTFVEIELQAPAQDVAHLQEVVWRWAQSLHLEKEERRSYLELLLAAGA